MIIEFKKISVSFRHILEEDVRKLLRKNFPCNDPENSESEFMQEFCAFHMGTFGLGISINIGDRILAIINFEITDIIRYEIDLRLKKWELFQ